MEKTTHFARYRGGKFLYACGNDGSGIINNDGSFNCKACLRVVEGKKWQMMLNAEYAKTRYYKKKQK